MKSREEVLLPTAHYHPSPNQDERPDEQDIDLLVIHCISLPPRQFGGPWIDDFFQNQLNIQAHPYFKKIASTKVSAHLLIHRNGDITQYVPLNRRAWHAGISSFDGRPMCNDYSIGIELEGHDKGEFTLPQYQALATVSCQIMAIYPAITPQRITGHSDIAPGRKTDPGDGFEWSRYLKICEKPKTLIG